MKMTLTNAMTWACGLAVASLLSVAHAAEGKAGIGASFKGPVGLQLYSLRDSFESDVAGSFEKVRAMGFRHVELAGTYGQTASEFRQTLAKHGLKAIAAHFPYEKFRDDAEGVGQEARALGLKYAGVAWIPHEGDFDETECQRAVEVFNRAGAVLARHGVRFFYHIHGYEFQPCPGGTLFDRLVEQTDRKTVAFEMDIFWVAFPGQDPVRLLKKYGKRWGLMHLKDMRRGLDRGSLTGSTDVRNDVALGAGQIDLPPLLRAAKKAGVKWYFLEDESPSVEIQLPDSLRYLENVRF